MRETDTNTSFINNGNETYNAGFSDITVPTGGHTLPLPAQSGGYSRKIKKGGKSWKGGRKGTKGRRPDKSKIKNISNMYKMPARKIRKLKQTLRKKLSRNRRASKKRVRFSKRHMRGGSTVSYSIGGVLSPSDSALANGYLQLNSADQVPYNHF